MKNSLWKIGILVTLLALVSSCEKKATTSGNTIKAKPIKIEPFEKNDAEAVYRLPRFGKENRMGPNKLSDTWSYEQRISDTWRRFFSPSSRYVLYEDCGLTSNTSSFSITVHDLESNTITNIGRGWSPTWRFDEDVFYFLNHGDNAGRGPYDLWKYNMETGQKRLVMKNAFDGLGDPDRHHKFIMGYRTKNCPSGRGRYFEGGRVFLPKKNGFPIPSFRSFEGQKNASAFFSCRDIDRFYTSEKVYSKNGIPQSECFKPRCTNAPFTVHNLTVSYNLEGGDRKVVLDQKMAQKCHKGNLIYENDGVVGFGEHPSIVGNRYAIGDDQLYGNGIKRQLKFRDIDADVPLEATQSEQESTKIVLAEDEYLKAHVSGTGHPDMWSAAHYQNLVVGSVSAKKTMWSLFAPAPFGFNLGSNKCAESPNSKAIVHQFGRPYEYESHISPDGKWLITKTNMDPSLPRCFFKNYDKASKRLYVHLARGHEKLSPHFPKSGELVCYGSIFTYSDVGKDYFVVKEIGKYCTSNKMASLNIWQETKNLRFPIAQFKDVLQDQVNWNKRVKHQNPAVKDWNFIPAWLRPSAKKGLPDKFIRQRQARAYLVRLPEL